MADQIDYESINLYAPVIDGREEEELYQLALNVVADRSRGTLTDFSDSNPMGVLLRAQAFSTAELLYRLNKLPLAFALKFLELTGAQRRLGALAIVSLTFYLSGSRSTPFIVPKGFQVVSASGSKSFFTETVLTIPAGAVSGVVSAVAEQAGPSYNLAAYTVTQVTQPLAFLSSVVNTEPSQGGAEAESVESAIERGLVALRRRLPVSAIDFEQAAEAVMGDGSRAKAIGLLGLDKISEQKGAVHLFLLDSAGQPANPALMSSVYQSVAQTMLLGTSLYTSPMEVVPISGVVGAKLLDGQNANSVADELWEAFRSHLSPAAFSPGSTVLIQELGYSLRFVLGIEFIDSLELNERALNIPMPNDYTLPEAFSLAVDLVDVDGNIFNLVRGSGELPNFNPAP